MQALLLLLLRVHLQLLPVYVAVEAAAVLWCCRLLLQAPYTGHCLLPQLQLQQQHLLLALLQLAPAQLSPVAAVQAAQQLHTALLLLLPLAHAPLVANCQTTQQWMLLLALLYTHLPLLLLMPH
jgi:hypothetical protein